MRESIWITQLGLWQQCGVKSASGQLQADGGCVTAAIKKPQRFLMKWNGSIDEQTYQKCMGYISLNR